MFRPTKDDEAMKETIKTKPLNRSMSFDRSTIDVEARTVDLSFSSEFPVRRWFGTEVLDHSPSSCDLSRLNNGGALLDNHDPDEQIGVVVPGSARIDPDRIGRAKVKFSRSQEGESKFQDVQDGIITLCSTFYAINQMVETTTTDADGDEDTICRAMSWMPLEISLVAIPADPTVGVGRSAGAEEIETVFERREKPAPVVIPAIQTPQIRSIDMDQAAKDAAAAASAARADGAQVEQKRTADLTTLADTYAKYGARELVGDFVRSGKSVQEFQNAIMDKMATRHSDAGDLKIGMNDGEVQEYSLARAINASINKDWSKAGLELEASNAVAKRTGMVAEGFFVPVEAFSKMSGKRAFDAGTAGNAGNLVQTSVLGGEFVDVLRNALVLNKMGIRVLGGLTSNIAIPRKTAASTISNATETAQFSATNPTTTQILLSPKRIGASIPYTKQALLQSSLDVESMLRDDLAAGIAVMIDNMGLNGTGTAPQPRGLVAQSGIGAVVGGTNGAQVAWSHLVGLESACANVNAEPDQLAGYVINTKTRGWAKQQPKVGTTFPNFLWDSGVQPLNGYRTAVTNNMVSNGTKGTAAGVTSTLAFSSDWSNFILALFGGLDIVVDPYSLADSGQIKLTANQFIDIGLRNPACFAVMTDALTV
jgi:HK97 family phage major capsid protein